MSDHVLDLTKRHFTRPLIGTGITVIGTWWKNADGRWRPALVLVPTNKKLAVGRIRPCIVPVDDAHLWAEETGSAEYAYGAAGVFAGMLGVESAVTVINAIHSEIGELLTMPPLPPGEARVVADATITDAAGRQRSLEIVNRV